jgi:AcrR family transcriptional regulator
VSATPQPVRRRNRHEVEAAVREALLRLLSEGRSFKDITVDELSRAAGLSRTAFYFYFPGKEQALMSAASEVTAELFERADTWWHGEGPPEELVRGALDGILQVYVEHAALLRATVELTSYSQEFEDFYKGLLDRFVRATADHLRRERDAGRVSAALQALQAAAAGAENTMPPLLDAVRAYATVGEMCDALRQVWGEYEEVPII